LTRPFFAIVAVLLAVSAFAATPAYLVKDINTTLSPAGSNPHRFLEMGALSFFVAGNLPGTNAAPQLWRTDGTEAGTFQVGQGGEGKIVWNGRLWFSGGHGDLWSTDGTVAGTQKITLPDGVYAYTFMATSEAIYFFNSYDLWRTDGTPAGTRMVSANAPALTSYTSSWTALGPWLYYSGVDGPGSEIWRTDGTSMVKVTNLPDYDGPAGLVTAGNFVYYSVNSSREVWRTDGTAAGTVRPPGAGPIALLADSRLLVSGSSCYFVGNDGTGMKFWRSDAAGTVALATSLPGTSSTFDAAPQARLANGTWLFQGPNVFPAWSLWAFDGTNTTLAASLPSYGYPPPGWIVVGNQAFIGNAYQLWRTDGTGGGTYSLGGFGASYTPFDWPMGRLGLSLLIGAARDNDNHGNELWKSDGTLAGTQLLKDIVPATESSSPEMLRPFRGGVLFNASSGERERDLYFSDGTEAGTQKIVTGAVLQLAPCGDRAFYVEAQSHRLGTTDGTAGGTSLIPNLPNWWNIPARLTCLDNRLFFWATANSGGPAELWRTDGTTAGTMLVKNLPDLSAIGQPVPLGHRLLFAAGTYAETTFWITDGTADGTQALATVPGAVADETTFGFYYSSTVAAGNLVYFDTVLSNQHNLWRTDGTKAGTIKLASGGNHYNLTRYGNKLAYADSALGLCSTNGSVGGTSCFDPSIGNQNWLGFAMRELNGRLYYNVPELRSTDGVTATVTGVGRADWLHAAEGGRLFVLTPRPGDESHSELVETDGSPSGTRTILDRYSIASAGSAGRLFIVADEVYAYDLPVAAVSLTPGSVQARLAGQSVTINGRGLTAPAAVFVDGAAVTVTATSATAITFVAPAREPGTYTVEVVTGDQRHMTLDLPLAYICTAPASAVSQPAAVCPNVPVTLHGSGGTACHWFPAAGLDDPSSCNPVATVDKTTTYVLIVTNAGGCESTNNPAVTVTVTPAPSESMDYPYTMPLGVIRGAGVSNAGAGATYAWTITGGQFVGDSTTQNIRFSASGCSDVRLQVITTNAAGCSTTSVADVHLITDFQLGAVNRLYGPNAIVTVPATGLGFECINQVSLDPVAPATGPSVPVANWAGNANTLSFGLPPGAPAEFYVTVRGPGVPFFPKRRSATTGYYPRRDDFDGDGRTDILWRNPANGVTLSWSLSPNGVITTSYVRGGDPDYEIAGVAELGGNNTASDILWRRSSTGALSTTYLSGGVVTADVSWPAPPAGSVPAATGDFDGDGRAELVMRDTQSGATTLWAFGAAASVQQQLIHGGNNLTWSIVGSRDFDGDGKSDILWRNLDGSTVLWLMNGAAIRESRFIHLGGNTDWTIAALGDFDGDTKADILWRNKQTGMTLIWLMDGLALRSSEIVHNGSNLNWAVAGAGDFDADGKSDIFWRDVNTGQTLYWKMNGSHITGTVYIHPGGNLAWTIEGPRF
jgi:ELWxxDGT repeat protein